VAPLACGYTQGGWQASPNGNNAAMLLSRTFSTVFPAGVTIGDPTKYTATWTTAAKIDALSTGGGAGALTSDLIDPTSTSAGVFATHVLAATLNIAYSDYAFTLTNIADSNYVLVHLKFANPIEDLGGLRYCPKVDTGSPLAGLTIDEIMVIANTLLGGNAVPGFTIAQVDPVVDKINLEWDNCGGPNTGEFIIADDCSGESP
jgi:hypothetical protein